MSGLSLRAQQTIISTIHELETNRIDYTIARNYENYPDFGHDLDLFYHAPVLTFEKIAKKVAAKNSWDIVTYCDHWSKSSISEHNIDVFRFYKLDTSEYLQIDLFRGFLIWGIPFISAEEILKERKLHSSGFFYRPNGALENIFRLLQINSLIGNDSATNKVSRYRERVLRFCDSEKDSLLVCGKKRGLFYIDVALKYLHTKDYSRFSYYMNKSKKRFLIRYVFKHPINSFRQLIARVGDYYRLFYASPCGVELNIYASDLSQKKIVESELNELIKNDFISSWVEAKNKFMLTVKERRILERAGVVIRWVAYQNENILSVNECESRKEISRMLCKSIIFRHKVIFSKS